MHQSSKEDYLKRGGGEQAKALFGLRNLVDFWDYMKVHMIIRKGIAAVIDPYVHNSRLVKSLF